MLNIFEWNEPQIFTFFFVLIRVTSLIVVLPLFGDKTVPPMVKLFFALSFSFVAFPVAWGQGVRVPRELFDAPMRLTIAIVSDICFGLALGFVARWIFEAIHVAGYVAGTSMGFSMASVLDPHSETQAIAVAELQYIFSALLFLSLEGHHIYLKVIIDSFATLGPGAINLGAVSGDLSKYMIEMTAGVLGLGLKLAAPVLVVILLVNLIFGIMTRAVPQMNVMAVSFTANIMIGLFVSLVSFPGFLNMLGGAFENQASELLRFVRLFGG